ncbi:MAG TPA: DUF86 domain-containing protein [Ideonella sp.]|nr:DUF86 domain-containing protein [Ideonella sp.]
MSGHRLPDYLEHILEAAQQAVQYVEALAKDEFLADRRTQQAVVLNLVIVGEAATQLIKDHQAFLDRFPEIPWASMKGMRNRLAHGYFDINLDVVWDTVQTALPPLIARLPALLQEARQIGS